MNTYKTLTKIAKQRTTIPILSTVCVTDNMAMTTDMDMQITDVAPDIEQGTYHARGFAEGMYHNAGLPIADFPTFSPLAGAEVGRMTILAGFITDQMAWVAEAMSAEETRYYLRGICFPFGKNEIVATDGHRLHMASIAANWPNEGVNSEGVGPILPAPTVKTLIALVKEKKPQTVTVIFRANGMKFKVGTATLSSKLIDGTFPDYNRFITKVEESDKCGTWKAAEFKPIHKALKVIAKISGTRRGCPMVIQEEGIINHRMPEAKGDGWKVSVKPCRDIGFNADFLAEVCDGEMYVTEAYNPAVFKGNGRLAVLMPLRV